MSERIIPGLIRDPLRISGATPNQIVQGQEDTKNAILDEEADKIGFTEALKESFVGGNNAAVQIFYDLQRMSKSGPVDPAWRDAGGNYEWVRKNSGRIPASHEWRYIQTKNSTEAEMMLDDAEYNTAIQQKLARRFALSPVSTFAAMGLSSIVDVDAPIALMSGGMSAGAKLGLMTTRVGRLLSGAAAGAVAGAGVQGAAYGANPAEDWTSIPVAGLAGMAFGVAGAALRGRPAHLGPTTEQLAEATRTRTLDEFGEAVGDGNVRAREDLRNEPQVHSDPYGSQRALDEAAEAEALAPATQATPEARTPQAVKLEAVAEARDEALAAAMPEELEGRATVGARQMQSGGAGVASIRSSRTVDIIQNARTRDQQLGVSKEWFSNNSNLKNRNDAIGRAATRFNDVVNAMPFATDFSRFMRSGSVTAQMLAYDMLENASGIIRNNRSGAMLMDHYHKDILGNFMPYHDAFDEWASRTHNASIWTKVTDNSLRERFNIAVISELNERNYGGAPRVIDPAVQRAADAIDNTFKREVEVNKGRPGEGTTKGYETLDPKSGYFPQKWLGGKMQKLIDSGQYGNGMKARKALTKAIAEAYVSMHRHMQMKDAEKWAGAVVDRALSTNEGISMNLVGIMKDADGRKPIEDLMIRNGASKHEVDRLIETLTGTKEEAGRAGHTKHRIDADMRFVASNGIKLMDLIDTDINKLVGMRARTAAGTAAMARKGIYSKADIAEIKEAILQEQIANGQSVKTGDVVSDFIDKDRHLTAQDLDDLFTYFNGQPIAGGISPWYSRVRKLTNLALLNQLGLTQMAEFGPQIAAIGWKRFSALAGKELMDTLHKKDSPLVQELKHMNVFVPEERMFRDDLTFEYEKLSGTTNEYVQKFDNFLNKGQRLQGYTSLFYTIRKLQQRIALTSGADKVMTAMKAQNWSTDRMRDIGLDDTLMHKIKGDYVDTGIVQFQDGMLHKLNLDKWDDRDAEDFILAMNRNVNQLVQKAMAGESSAVFHRDGLAAIFWHLKSFPMLALEKQTMRNARIADMQAMGTFMYGLATAGMAYTVKQTINGRDDNLTPSKIAREAFGLSNMTGWIPMWVDPLAGMLGLDSFKLSSYGSYGSTDVISLPAISGTLDKMLQLPGTAAKIINPFVDLKNSDIRTLQAIPIIGNAYGFAYMFNAMKS